MSTEAPAAVRGISIQALLPILEKRPVSIHLALATDGRIHFTLLPKQVDAKEDAALGRGFSVTATAEELDEALAEGIPTFTDSHETVQKVIEQIASANQDAAEDRLRKQRDKGKKPQAPAPAAKTAVAAKPAAATATAAAGAETAPEEPAEPETPAEAPNFFD